MYNHHNAAHRQNNHAGRDRPSQDKYDRFEAWLRENGAQFELLELREYDTPKAEPTVDDKDEEEKKEQVTRPNSTKRPAASYAEEDEEEECEMRGVHARMHIAPNTVCMSIPRRCLVTVEMGQDTPIGQAILRSDLDLDAPKHIFLMIYLLWDRKVNGSKSFFHPYYEILPQTLRNMPIFWTPQELQELQGSYLLQQIQDRNDAIAEDYHAICKITPLAKICTLEEFKWARMCVCSRNFGLQIDGNRTSALVPHADMLNHYRPRETKWTFDEDRQAFTITTLQPIPPGAQVYDSYGQKCNHRFLLNYGFAVEDNRELDGFCPNEVPIELTLNPNDPLFAQKMEFWMRGEVTMNTTTTSNATIASSSTSSTSSQSTSALLSFAASHTKRIRVCVSNNENTRTLFSLLRAMNCNAEELRAITTPVTSDVRSLFVPDHAHHHHHHHHNHHHRGATTPPALAGYYRSSRDIRHPLCIRNERAAMVHLLQIISAALAKYPTSLAQDKTDLLDERLYPRFSNKRHAKIQVRGEKEVLHHFARWARTALDVLDVMEQEFKEEQQRGVEVQLGRGVVPDDSSRSCGYDYIVRRMEEEETGVHHTIVRYCADVLGSLRREELKNLRRHRALMAVSAGNSNSK